MKAEAINILIVDDMESIRQVINEQLVHMGITGSIVHAQDGSIAYNKLSVQKFDILITDILMPKMTGDKLIEELKHLAPAHRPKATIIISGDSKHKTLAEKYKNTYYVEKPIIPNVLKDIISNVFEDKTQIEIQNKKRSVDVKFINPFIDATLKVLETTCFTLTEKEDVYLKEKNISSGDISALIQMNSNHFRGSMALSFEKQCFLAIVGTMLGETYTEIIPEIEDAAGELCNQIFGLAKVVLNQKGFGIQPAIPSIITGTGHTIKHLIPGPCIAVKFNTKHGPFYIEAIVETISAR